MKELKFKTTLSCGGCVSKVQSDLDSAVGSSNWHVDTDNPEKILTIQAEEISKDEIIAIIEVI
ncbi:MAG: hypothetical protein GX163_12035 [Bacteroidetes bacterium]|jgi:copper chaperone CopZ|nr:hypothetical protein [Bacteroidota bacterium]